MSYLDKFLFYKFDANRKVSELSGGEQARLLLAKLMLEQGNLLILDEPTNDLDIPTLQILEKNLNDYQGGVKGGQYLARTLKVIR
jgi:ATP-binding cassette subfamily F protein uup